MKRAENDMKSKKDRSRHPCGIRLINRKGFMHTLEAAVAIIISFLFLLFVMNSRQESEFSSKNLDLISVLKENLQFRDCVISENYSCLNSSIRTYYPDFVKLYDYRINISRDPNIVPLDLPQKDVQLETLFIVGNISFLDPKTVRVYYWIR